MWVKSENSTRPLIGLFVDKLYYEYSFLIGEGVKAKIKEMGGRLIFFVGGLVNNPFRNDRLKCLVYQLARSQDIDGIISVSSVIATNINKKQYTSFIKSFDPPTIVNIGASVNGYFNIEADNFNGIRQMVTHCIKAHGCKKIALIKGPENHEEVKARFATYKDTLKEYNITFNPDIVINGSFYTDCGRTAIIELLDKRKAEFDAVLCANDYVAITAIQELQRRGLRVPQDIIVTGYDNINSCNHLHLPLTTVHQPCFEMGYQAAQNLYSQFDGKRKPTGIKLPCRFIARQSCGCNNHDHEAEAAAMGNCLSSVRLNMLNTNLSAFKKKTTGIMNFHEFKEIIYESLPQFGVKTCFVFVYDPQKITPAVESSMLVMGYKNYQILDTKNHNTCKAPEHIMPFCKKRMDNQDTMYAYPLVFRDELFGYVFYIIDEKGEKNGGGTGYNEGSICELLTQELAASLNSIKHYKLRKKTAHNSVLTQSAFCADYETAYNLSDAQTEQYFDRLITYMEKEKPYINDRLTLYDLARELKIPRSYLSYSINKYAKSNFYDLLHSFRVKEAKNILSDSRYDGISILDVAFNCGFKAKSTFNKIFKKQTGMTPTDFRSKN
ncbi:MAG: substrate-binding domain-containing protein, partial [Spirochaetia bacterium]